MQSNTVRLVFEAAIFLGAAFGAGAAGLAGREIVAVMGAAWVVVAAIELSFWYRARRR